MLEAMAGTVAILLALAITISFQTYNADVGPMQVISECAQLNCIEDKNLDCL
jgi:hypothetical protein